MAYSYNIEEVPPADVPCVEHDIRRAKKFLQRHSEESGDSLYDHLTELLAKIIAERPPNAVDIFEDISRRLKEERYKNQSNHLRDIYVPPPQYEDAKKLIKLFQDVSALTDNEQEELDEDEDGGARTRKPHMLDLLYFFEQVDIGMPRREMVILNLSIRKFMATTPVDNVRFWGKIIGNPKNYYILEADLQAEEVNRRLEQQEAEEQARKEKAEAEAAAKVAADEEAAAKVEEAEEEKPADAAITENEEAEEKGLVLVFPPMPVNTWKPPVEVASEKIGSGANKKTYFVCSEPGLHDWIELPPVTPQQIVTARQIIRCFTGNLGTPIHTFPPFPGNEKNYLRAQIARISAATLVSPIGFYTFGSGDEEEEFGEEAGQEDGVLSENVHYDPLPVKDLIDPSMSNWCHHSPYLLQQGRVVWWSPGKEEDELDEEVEEEEEEEDEDETGVARVQKEVGPPLLTPLSEDATLDSVVPWTARESSHLQPDISVGLVRSNVWPGAFAFATGRRCANLYIGWGHKYTAYNYSPPPMPHVMDEYKIGPEVMEMQDPTFEEEEAYRIAHLPPVIPVGGEEEEVEEEEEEDDEDDEEDDE